MSKKRIAIGGKIIGAGQPVFIIAEAGVNHNGKFSLAKKLIDAAARAGADAVKFQTFSPDELVTKTAAKAEYQERNNRGGRKSLLPKTDVLPLRKGEWAGKETQYEMLKKLELPRAAYGKLKRYAEKKGLIFLSTPFSLEDARFLKRLGVKAIKVGSGDANNVPYLRRIAAWKLPVMLSTGMCSLKEVKVAVRAIQNHTTPPPAFQKKRGAPLLDRGGEEIKLILLHCATNYPAQFSEANLRAIQTLQKTFGFPVGFSDHTRGSEAAIAAVALGAVVIEKHLTLNRELHGPDHQASVEPAELKEFVRHIRNTEAALGSGKKMPFPSERKIARVVRKSIVVLRDIKKGERFTERNLGIKRPGTGLAPKYYEELLGSRATQDIKADTLLKRNQYEA